MRNRYCFGTFELDGDERVLSGGGRPIPLTRKAFDVLLCLAAHGGRLVTREQLMSTVWAGTAVDERTLNWTVGVVRKALQAESEQAPIETVRGLGYRLLAQVERIEAPRAPGGHVASRAPILPAPAPRRAGLARVRIAALGLAALLLVGDLWSRGRREVRPSIAVVGFRDLAGRPQDAWLGAALAEMTAAELGQGRRLRVFSSEEVGEARRELGLAPAPTLTPDQLGRVRRRLGTDWVVAGAYLVLRPEQRLVRVDVNVQDAQLRAAPVTVTRTGREDDLFEVVASIGDAVRAALGVAEAASTGAAARGSLPSDPRARRLYAEGLAQLRLLEALAAIPLLEQAEAAQPDFPGAPLALSRAAQLLGRDSLEEEAALRAYRLSAQAEPSERLAIEANYLRAARKWDKAIEAYRRLAAQRPESTEYAFDLAAAQITGGRTKDGLATLAGLRARQGRRADARGDLYEAEAWYRLGDHRRTAEAAERAQRIAESQGATTIQARALLRRSFPLRLLGGPAADAEARAAVEQATRASRALGDLRLVGRALNTLGAIQQLGNDLDGAARSYGEAVAVFESIGAESLKSVAVYNLALIAAQRGDLREEQRRLRESFDLCHTSRSPDCRDRLLNAWAMNLRDRGDLAGSRAAVEEALARHREQGSRNREAEALSIAASLAFLRGDDTAALAAERLALGTYEQLGLADDVAWTRAGLALQLADAGRPDEAKAQAGLALATALSQGPQRLEALARGALAVAQLASGDLAAAERESAAAQRLVAAPAYPLTALRVLAVRARVLLARRAWGESETAIGSLREASRASGAFRWDLEGRWLGAQLAAAQGRAAAARALLADLRDDARSAGFTRLASRAEEALRRSAGGAGGS